MKSYMLNVQDFRDSRFEKLFEILAESNEGLDKAKVVGHLALWRLRWAGDESFDHGIFWDVDLTRMGMWAEFANPKAFGLALKGAGYIKLVEDVWPAELVAKRKGYVAVLADGGIELDASWTGWHRKCSRKHELFVYLSDQQRRVDWAFQFSPPYNKEKLPPGWLDGSPSGEARAGRIGAGFSSEGSAGVTHDQVGVSGAGVTSPNGGRRQGGESPPQGGQSGVQGGQSRPPAVPPPYVQNTSKNERTKRRLLNRTGYEPTPEMRDFIREHKYDQTMRCLVEMDDGQETMAVWHWSVTHMLDAVQERLARMTETDEAWSKIANPTSVVFGLVFKPYMDDLRARRRKEAEGRGNGRGAALRVVA